MKSFMHAIAHPGEMLGIDATTLVGRLRDLIGESRAIADKRALEATLAELGTPLLKDLGIVL